jgi:ATP-binding cassette, subfamily B, bacterial
MLGCGVKTSSVNNVVSALSSWRNRDGWTKKWRLGKKIAGYLKPYRTKFALWYGLRLFSSTLALVVPYATARLIDDLITGLSTLPFWIGVIIGSSALGMICRQVSKYKMNMLILDAKLDLKMSAMDRMLSYGLGWHEERPTGKKLQQVSSGSTGFRNILRFMSRQSTDIIVGLVGVTVVFASMNVVYGIIAATYVAIYLTVEFLGNRRQAPEVKTMHEISETRSAKIHDIVSSVQTVKSLGLTSHVNKEVRSAEQLLNKQAQRVHFIGTSKWTILNIVSMAALGTLLYIIGSDVLSGAQTPGMLALFVSYTGRIRGSLAQISGFADMLVRSFIGLGRIEPFLKESEVKETQVPQWNELTLKDVYFSYKSKKVLSGVNLEIMRGEKLGIVGASGQGKSSLFKLLLGLYTPDKGSVTFGGKDTYAIHEEAIAKQIALVPQEVELFSASLRENIGFGKKGSLSLSLLQAECADLIESLPEGLETQVGEKGVKLSGGQKQRIGIARALFKQTPILLLDESTSSLDSETETRVQTNLYNLEDKTIIMIAHRLSTLRGCDRIIVLDQGRIVEEGTFAQLMEQEGIFARMHTFQQA